MSFAAFVISQNAHATEVCGDVVTNGKVDGTDLGMMNRAVNARPRDLRGIEHMQRLRQNFLPKGDLNLDGKLDDKDVNLLRQLVGGSIKCLPCPTNRNACQPPNRTPSRRGPPIRGFL